MIIKPQHIVLASANPHKVTEMEQILESAGIGLYTLADFADMPDVVEDGETLQANALLKALAVERRTGLASLADDTGLEVDALGGAPGVYTARYAGEKASYAENVAKLLNALVDVPHEKRTARFRTVIAFMMPLGDPVYFEGVVEGHISSEARGEGGFGYDPVFVPAEGDGRTFAEMEPRDKHLISHRGRALAAFREWIAHN